MNFFPSFDGFFIFLVNLIIIISVNLIKLFFWLGIDLPCRIIEYFRPKKKYPHINNTRTIRISGGTIYNSGAGAMSLGDVSGTVANTINQLPKSSQFSRPGLRELLSQLQAAIEAESSLDDECKAYALELIEVLANAGTAPQEEAMQKTARRAIIALKGVIVCLPTVSPLFELGSQLLPRITDCLGF
jgi:hypothetical protein